MSSAPLSNLLKYRFTKKTNKMTHDDPSSENSLETISPENSEPSVISETDMSQQSTPSNFAENESPLFLRKNASLLTGFNDALLKRKKVAMLSYGRRRLQSDSSSEEEEEKKDNADSDEEERDNAGSDSCDDASNNPKRNANFSQDDIEPEEVQIKKRRRIKLLSESSEDLGMSSQETIPPDKEDTISDTEETKHDMKEEKINQLRQTFPAACIKKLEATLVENNYDVEMTADSLLGELKTEESDDKETKEHSEKAKKSVENGGKMKKSVSVNDDDDDDDFSNDGHSDQDSEQEENSSERGSVLSFFDTASLADLISMPGCSKKKAEVIKNLRPFESWNDLVTKFTTTKTISYSLIGRYWEIIQIREVVMRLMKRCEQLSEKLGTMVTALSSHTTMEDIDIQIQKQPKILNPNLKMKPYQIIGLNWLRLLHTQQLNGILADEMGLGKTVQTISFLAHLLEEGEEGPHIIVVPSSTVENWLREIATWCPDLQVLLYYGSQDERRRLRREILYEGNEDYNILLTTYNMTSGSLEDRSLFKTLEFQYAVFDEGHMLKNMTSQRYQNLQKIRAHRRLLLTGTPLQNNLVELMSLLCFVMPDMFVGKTESLKKMFTFITKGSGEEGSGQAAYEKERIANAKNIMKPFLLRRLKKDVLSQMPAKEEKVEYCPMVTEQQVLYDNLVETFSKKLLSEGTQPSTGSGGSAILMQLRKASNHPLLMRNLYTDAKLEEMAEAIAKEPSHRDRGATTKFIQEDMAVMSDFELHCLCNSYKRYLGEYSLDTSYIGNSGKLMFLVDFLSKRKEKGDRVLLFSQFTMVLDIIEAQIKLEGYKYLRLDGQTPVIERQQMIDEYNKNEDIFVFLLSTRAGGLGINLTAANVVVLHDIDFNPYNDKQAEDRCHRLGQTRRVEVVKLISKGTVEEGMLSCAKYKLNLEKDVTSNDADDEDYDVVSLLKTALGKHLKQDTN